MSQEVFIFEITEKSFPAAVLENSHKIPVVVEFMGVWSEHCAAVETIFNRLAREFAGQFIFAKIDVDEQRELMKQYQVENLPTLIVFHQGEAKRVEQGVISEQEARMLLREFGVSRPSDELRLQAREKHVSGDTQGAIMLLTQAIQQDPSNTRVAMDMVQIFIDINLLDNAEGLFAKLPTQERDSEQGRSLNDQLLFAKAAARTDGIAALNARIQANAQDLNARFDLALCFMAQHDGKSAMDQLLFILEQDTSFREGAAKDMMISIIRIFKTNHPDIAQEYQRKLSGLLAK